MSFQMSITHFHAPSFSSRQTATAFPSTITCFPSGALKVTRLVPVVYATSPLRDTATVVVFQEMLKPGVRKLFITNSRMATLPTTAELAGGSTIASSAQKDRTLSTSRFCAALDHSASSRRISERTSDWPPAETQPASVTNTPTTARTASRFTLYRPIVEPFGRPFRCLTACGSAARARESAARAC